MPVGELHAAVLIAVPVATVALAIRLCKRRPSARRVIFSLVALSVPALLSILTLVHSCSRGNPDHHMVVMFVAVAGTLVFVTDLGRALALAVILGGVPYALGLEYNGLVHGKRYTGISRSPLDPTKAERVRREYVARLLDRGREDTANHEACWLMDSSLLGFARERCVRGEPEFGVGLWHSPITKLYEQRHPMDLWYPGGKLSEAAPRIEWRERSATR